MNAYDQFLSDDQTQAVTPPPENRYDAFLRDEPSPTLQQAQASTVVNSTQSADAAAKAAPIGRQLGLPQPAVEADLPRFQQQAKVQANTALVARNPILASWVAANPDAARIAQDEYAKFADIEQILTRGQEGLAGVGHAALQGLGGSFNAAGTGLNRQLLALTGVFAPLAAADAGLGLIAPQASTSGLLRRFIGEGEQAQPAFKPANTIAAQAGATVGNLLGLLSQITLTGGGGGEAVPASAGGMKALAEGVKTAARSMAFPSLTAASNKGAEVFQATGDEGAAARAAAGEYAFTTAQGVVPFSAPGGIVRRVITGGVSGGVTSEAQRSAMNLLLPEQMQQAFDPQQAIFQAVTGAVLGGVMGPRGEPNYAAQIRQTYVDAARAAQAQRDAQRIGALGQISAESKLREADPQAFRRFVETVSDKSELDAVYIRPQDLQDALAQSPVDLTAVLPEVARQIPEALTAGTDVRIPVADFATHIAGTDLEKAIMPNLKPSPEGMTFKEGEAFYQDVQKNMEAKAKEMAGAQEKETALEQDRQAVHQAVYDQLVAAGRAPGEARGGATLVEAFYATQAERLGMKPSELFAKLPLRVVAERVGETGGLEQAGADATVKQIGDKWVAYRTRETGGEDHLGYFDSEQQANAFRDEHNARARVEANRAAGAHAAWWTEDSTEFVQSTGKRRLDSVTREELTRRTLDARKDSVEDNEQASSLRQIESRAGFCFKCAAEASANGIGDMVIGETHDPDGNPIWHAVVMRDGAIYDPTFGRWFKHGVYEGLDFKPVHTLTTEQVQEFIRSTGGLAPDAKNQGLGDVPGTLKQSGAESKGLYQPSANTIALLKNADLSTFLHESGHSFLHMLGELSKAPDAPEGMRADMETLAKWMGAADADTWRAMTLEQQRVGHEKFARAFESYLMEGKAPTFELQSVFSRFRAWLLNVYTSLRGLQTTAGQDISFSPEVRAVFDRLLASEHAIKETEAARSYMPLWKTAQEAGMTPEQFTAYVKLGEDASAHALDEMQAKSLADMRWAGNAKDRAMRSMRRAAVDARKEVRAQAAKDVDAMPIFQLKDYLKSIKNYDPDIVANAHGYEDAHHMEQALEAAGDKKDMVAKLTDQRMLEQYGELLSPEAIEMAANYAVHNEARARFMATGLKVLTKSPLPAAQIARAAKEAAETAVGMKRIADLNPKTYLAAETRANRDALKAAAKDPQAAIEAQRAAVLSNRLAKASQDALDEVKKGLVYLKKFDTAAMAKKVGGDYMDRINELLSQYDVTNRFNTANAQDARLGMREWIESERARTGNAPDVSDALLDFAQRKHWKELSFSEFLGLVDAVKSLEHVGGNQTTLTMLGKRIELADMVQRAKAGMADLPHSEPADLQPHLAHAKGLDRIATQFLNAASKVRGMDAALIKMEQLFQWLTYGKRAGLGETRTGPFLEVFQRAADAEGAERGMRADSTADMRRLGDSLRTAGVNLNESLTLPLSRPGRGNQWYREELIAAALNTGNAGNLEKLTKGYGWDQRALMQVLDANLSKAEWQFVQGVWDSIGKYGPQIEALQKRLTGVGPKMVEPLTVHTQHGDFKGGYYPVVYDAFLDRSIEQKYAKNADALFENQYATPTTSQGHTVARTGYTGPIQLSLGVIPRHLDQVTHDLAWREAVIDMNKFLSHKEVQGEVDQVMGREYTKQFRPWLQAMANDRVFNTAGDSAWESFYRKARTNATMVGLGFRLSTMLIHGGSALSNSIGEVGAKWFAKGAAEFATPERWEQSKAFMFERSPEMANRFNEFDRNIREAIAQINEHQRSLGVVSATQKAVDGARRFAFYGVQALDMGSAAPTWMGAYLKGLTPEAKGGLGLSEEGAIDVANRAVRNAHGGGGTKDLSAVQRDKGVMSLATMFYSYWSHMYNRQRDIAKGFANLPQSVRQGTGTEDFARLLARSWFYFVIPQIVHALLKPSPQDQDETLAGHALHFGEEIALGFVSGVPVLRDLANAAINGRDYAISPLEQAGKSIVKAAVDTTKYVKGEEPSPHAGKNAMLAAGYAFGLPIGQAATAAPFLWDVFNGDASAQSIKDWYSGISHGRVEQ